MVLWDLGADVIKVEPPDGDIIRRLGPGDGEVSALFATTNRNKRSVRLDLRNEGDAEKARALAIDADVVVTNLDRSILEKAGLSPADLRDRNPGLIVVEISEQRSLRVCNVAAWPTGSACVSSSRIRSFADAHDAVCRLGHRHSFASRPRGRIGVVLFHLSVQSLRAACRKHPVRLDA